jgi:hypothetical protein
LNIREANIFRASQELSEKLLLLGHRICLIALNYTGFYCVCSYPVSTS